MEWDADKLNSLLNYFDITVHAVSKVTGITKEKLYKIKAGTYEDRKLDSILTAYTEALKNARIKELQSMIAYYENFKP